MQQVAPVLIEAADAREYAVARTLIEQYAAEIKIDLCFQEIDAELARLPEVYGPPAGCLLLALEAGAPGGVPMGGTPVGCGALRPFSAERCEMKRLFVRPQARGMNFGRLIAQALVAKARGLGYTHMLLDTLQSMTTAQALYRSLGFKETAAYYDNPLPDAVYMQLDL